MYLSISNGYKSGGVNQNPRLSEDNRLFKPEFNQNIDFGYKYKGQDFYLSLNVFYMLRE